MNNNLKKYLPSRRVISFIILPVAFVILFFVLERQVDLSKEKKAKSIDSLERTVIYNIKEKDTDNDGLLDWQERLYGTNETIEDTDGDGIPDGIEVKQGTDPLDKFNSGIKEDVEKIEDKTVISYKENKNLTVTDRVARDIFTKTIDLKKTNLNKNEGAISVVADEVFDQSGVYSISFYSIEKEDLSISKTTSKSRFKSKLFATLNKYDNGKSMENELILSYKMIVDSNQDARKKLENILQMFIDLKSDLLKNKVPNDSKLIELYLDYLNSLNLISDFVKSSLNYETDPVKSLAFLQSFDRIKSIMSYRSSALLKYLNK